MQFTFTYKWLIIHVLDECKVASGVSLPDVRSRSALAGDNIERKRKIGTHVKHYGMSDRQTYREKNRTIPTTR